MKTRFVFAAIVLLLALGALGGMWLSAEPRSPEPSPAVQVPCGNECSPPGSAPLQQVSNENGDLKAENIGDGVLLEWSALPPLASRILIYIASSPSGPWELYFDSFLSSAGSDSTIAAIDARHSDYFFRAQAQDSSGQILKEYGIVSVPRRVRH